MRAFTLPLLLLLGGCAFNPFNYRHPDRPRYVGSYAEAPVSPAEPVFSVATFNFQFAYGRNKAIALELLGSAPFLQADAIAMQEVDSITVRDFAEKLRRNYVYYPAMLHTKTDREFGNAVLSRWPIQNDWKLLLPHLKPTNSQRIAVGVDLDFGGTSVRVYSVHLSTIQAVGKRVDQARTILHDTFANCPKLVVVMGDFNSLLDRSQVAEAFEVGEFRWVTRDIGSTTKGLLHGPLDHVFTWGFNAPTRLEKIETSASDHMALFAELPVSEPRQQTRPCPSLEDKG